MTPWLKFALLVLAGIVLRDLWCWSAAKLWQRRRARQQQCRLAAERAEQAAQIVAREESRQRVQAPIARQSIDTMNAYPFVMDVRSEVEFILATREIVTMLRAADRRRFLAVEHTEGKDN